MRRRRWLMLAPMETIGTIAAEIVVLVSERLLREPPRCADRDCCLEDGATRVRRAAEEHRV
jgi:hypothetical protein